MNGATTGHVSCSTKYPLGSKFVPVVDDHNDMPFTSEHAGNGVNFVYCDGHVRFLHITIDFGVYQALSTRAGGDSVEGEKMSAKLIRIEVFLFCCAVLCTVLAGCGPGFPETADVSGRVTLGGKPVPQGRISFWPEQGRPAMGEIGPDGTYKADHLCRRGRGHAGNPQSHHQGDQHPLPGRRRSGIGRTRRGSPDSPSSSGSCRGSMNGRKPRP